MLIADFRSEYQRYRVLGERAMAQTPDAALNTVPVEDGNSIAMLVRHISGNLVSRFTDFLTTDGEKPDRNRDDEFETRIYMRAEVEEWWRTGWSVLERQLGSLGDGDVVKTVTIRGQPLSVHAALSRSLSHVAYHIGQMVLLARVYAAGPWQSLSIPKGQSAAYNRALSGEQAPPRA
jgi:hypothetical protein